MTPATNPLILHGCPIHPGGGRAPVEAIAIDGDRIVATGSLGEVRAAVGGAAYEKQLSGGALLPAFADPHQHAFLVAADPNVDVLHGCADIPDLLTRVAEIARSGMPSGWVRVHGYLPLDLAERHSPTAADLDSVCSDRPVHVLARTYHESVVNSAGLAALGITRTTPDPPGGEIVRDRRGRPTGVLIESASFLAEAASRLDDPTLWAQRLRAHGRRLAEHGIVRIGDGAVPAVAAAEFVRTLAEVGIEARPLLVGSRIDEPGVGVGAGAGGTSKVLIDGGERCHFCFDTTQLRRIWVVAFGAALGPDAKLARALSRASGRPRKDALGWHTGLRLTSAERLGELLRGAADGGGGLALHAVGNGAVAGVLDALAAERTRSGVGTGAGGDTGAGANVRIEHALTLDDELARRLGATGLPVVTQPGFLRTHARQLVTIPPPAPLMLFPLRSLLSHGAQLAFGSDYPAADLSPWPAIAAAVTRASGIPGRTVHSEQALTLAEALDATTATAARVLGVADTGVLAAGLRADLQWVDADPFAIAPEALADIRARAVWHGGVQLVGDLASGISGLADT